MSFDSIPYLIMGIVLFIVMRPMTGTRNAVCVLISYTLLSTLNQCTSMWVVVGVFAALLPPFFSFLKSIHEAAKEIETLGEDD